MDLKIGDKVQISRNSGYWRGLGVNVYFRGKEIRPEFLGSKTRLTARGDKISLGVSYSILKLIGQVALLSCAARVPIDALLLLDQRAVAKRRRREWIDGQPLNVVPVPDFLDEERG